MALIYEELVKTNKVEFLAKVVVVAKRLGISPDWLMGVMYIESKLDPENVNFQPVDRSSGKTKLELALTRATGLIQFMPATLKPWGVTGQDIIQMTNVAQLDYVEKYLTSYKGKLNAFVDLYFCVFRPTAVGHYLDYVLGGIGSELSKKIAKQNSGLDLDKDEQITKLEVQTKILYAIDKKHHPKLV
jgi:hypothetical protein